MHHPTDRITHTTAFVTPVVEHRLEWEILIRKSSPCSGSSSGFPLSLSEWSFTTCLTPYNCKLKVSSTSLNKIFPFFHSPSNDVLPVFMKMYKTHEADRTIKTQRISNVKFPFIHSVSTSFMNNLRMLKCMFVLILCLKQHNMILKIVCLNYKVIPNCSHCKR